MTAAARILAVDDEESIRTFVERVLKDAGYTVVTAPNGSGALRTVEEQPRFDLFVLDVLMPEMTGIELGRRLRERDPDAKILYLTGYSNRVFDEKNALWQSEAFVDKPVSVKGLREAVSLLLFGRTTPP